MGIFAEVCILGALTGQDMADQLALVGFSRASPETADAILTGLPGGSAWIASDPLMAGFPIAVVTRSGGVFCQVLAQLSAPADATAGFSSLLEGMASGGLIVRPERNTPPGPDAQRTLHLAYRANLAPSTVNYRFAMSAREPVPGEYSLLMAASRAE